MNNRVSFDTDIGYPFDPSLIVFYSLEEKRVLRESSKTSGLGVQFGFEELSVSKFLNLCATEFSKQQSSFVVHAHVNGIPKLVVVSKRQNHPELLFFFFNSAALAKQGGVTGPVLLAIEHKEELEILFNPEHQDSVKVISNDKLEFWQVIESLSLPNDALKAWFQNTCVDLYAWSKFNFKSKDQEDLLIESVPMPLIDDWARLWIIKDNSLYSQVQKSLNNKSRYFDAIVENFGLGLLEVDNEGRVMNINDIFEQMSGYTLTDLIGRKVSDVLLSEESKEKMSQISNGRLQGISSKYEMEIITRGGMLRNWLISAAPIVDGMNQVTGSIGIHWDITSFAKIAHPSTMVEAESKMQNYLVSKLSHLRYTTAHLLNSGVLQKAQSAQIGAISNGIDHLQELMSWKSSSRITGKSLEYPHLSFSINALLRNVANTFGHNPNHKCTSVEFVNAEASDIICMGHYLGITELVFRSANVFVKKAWCGSIRLHLNTRKEENRLNIRIECLFGTRVNQGADSSLWDTEYQNTKGQILDEQSELAKSCKAEMHIAEKENGVELMISFPIVKRRQDILMLERLLPIEAMLSKTIWIDIQTEPLRKAVCELIYKTGAKVMDKTEWNPGIAGPFVTDLIIAEIPSDIISLSKMSLPLNDNTNIIAMVNDTSQERLNGLYQEGMTTYHPTPINERLFLEQVYECLNA